jgi:glutamate synthase domain-containing protein 1/glutamate synthase domain-containing protein 3
MSFDRDKLISNIIKARGDMIVGMPPLPLTKSAEEGGCGVVGFAASVPVRGRHIFEPSIQMHNRGNGKGGGIAAACLSPEQLGVDEKTLREDYILQIALLDPAAEAEIEKDFIAPFFEVAHKQNLAPKTDHREFGLPVKPPDIVRWFVRVKPDVLTNFAREIGSPDAPARELQDEFVYRNSFRLNQRYYASLGEKRAFVLSHARNLLIFKIVGYAEHVVQYYGLEDLRAKIWIAHQRYPTKGRVWHPAGAHPFIGLNEALVHNGDFANYFSVTEYLKQRNIMPQFLTDTEVSVLLFDLWARVYKYPLEYVIESLAPTTELDFDQLPDRKKAVYRALQAQHMHGSPDGPWFFIIARSEPEQERFRLLGITDTAMLRPQVFALQEGDVSIGLVASEKQAIDAALHSLAAEDKRFRLVADRYWNARGGSHTDGGAFIFTVEGANGSSTLTCTDKFGRVIKSPPGDYAVELSAAPKTPAGADALAGKIKNAAGPDAAVPLFGEIMAAFASWNFDNLRWLMQEMKKAAGQSDDSFELALEILALLNDRRYDCGKMRRSMVLEIVRGTINEMLDSVPLIGAGQGRFKRIDWNSRGKLAAPAGDRDALVILAREFPPEGPECDARLAVAAFELGWRRFIVYGLKGQRFHGCGFGPRTGGVRMDLFGISGDYMASGLDGMEIRVHDNGQDQLAQIMKQGRLIVHGDVGQAFMYGAKGGEVYVMGNAAGRPLINAVGRPRVVINGTCLDYLAESFMAGDPLKGGGFVILNGITFDDRGKVVSLPTPYPGGNLFSLASGGAIFVRDPHKLLIAEQLNGGEFAELTDADWALIRPYLENNQRFFGIEIERDLLTVDGQRREPSQVYRKVRAIKLGVLAKETVPE